MSWKLAVGLVLLGAAGGAVAQPPNARIGEAVPRDVREIYDKGLQYLVKSQTERGDFTGGLHDQLGDFRIELAKVAVGDGRRHLDQAQRPNQADRQRLARDREILNGTLRLGAVIRLGGHADLAHGVFLDTELAHRIPS